MKAFEEIENGGRVNAAAGYAGFLQISAYANGVQGISTQDIAKTIREAFDVAHCGQLDYAWISIAVNHSGMTMKGVTVNNFRWPFIKLARIE